MRKGEFSDFLSDSKMIFLQGNHAGVTGNKVVSINEEPPYPAFSSKMWEVLDSGYAAFYEWHIPDDVMRFDFCIKRGLDFKKVPSIEGKVIEVKKSIFESWKNRMSTIYMPDKYDFKSEIDGTVTYINFYGSDKEYKWWGDFIPLELEKLNEFYLEIKEYIKYGSGMPFTFGIEGKLYAEFLGDKIEQFEMNFIRSFYDNVKSQNVEIKTGNKLLLSQSMNKYFYKLVQQDNNFKYIRLIYEELEDGVNKL
ncbi:hypothetical protein [Pseudobacteroides cellulosolvens]|uniref:Uncharacterized protein n=1 Tax=Pseudobacteroides cellulosolvens ATCC 35603 = DSM 2933 TaxID=398512 RepID=A0A0L6JNH1_9FIRM|nr:hypothetical protein [Pseudobacteroides cellulosolvens]KNY26902.1 hypothetical protein Bccel_2167 [Pseudobacteroides cellulosolvens ATCC 35603 = DSM 2933]